MFHFCTLGWCINQTWLIYNKPQKLGRICYRNLLLFVLPIIVVYSYYVRRCDDRNLWDKIVCSQRCHRDMEHFTTNLSQPVMATQMWGHFSSTQTDWANRGFPRCDITDICATEDEQCFNPWQFCKAQYYIWEVTLTPSGLAWQFCDGTTDTLSIMYRF